MVCGCLPNHNLSRSRVQVFGLKKDQGFGSGEQAMSDRLSTVT